MPRLTALLGIATLGAAAVLAPTGASHAQGWEPQYADGELQPLPDGFPDRPIVLINTDDAGSPDGIGNQDNFTCTLCPYQQLDCPRVHMVAVGNNFCRHTWLGEHRAD